MSQNLLVNPGFEIAYPSATGFSGVTIPGWKETGTPTVIQYGTPRAYPLPIPGPRSRRCRGCLPVKWRRAVAVTSPVAGPWARPASVKPSTSSAAAKINTGPRRTPSGGLLGGYLLEPVGDLGAGQLPERQWRLIGHRLDRAGHAWIAWG